MRLIPSPAAADVPAGDQGRGGHWRQQLPLGLVLLLYVLMIVYKAWVCDDAYITFRTIDNFTHGLGPVYNPGERVQAYTHPLWMLCVSAFYLLTGEFFYTVFALTALLSVGAVIIVSRGLAASVQGATLGVAVLASSRAFTDYATSGLENALTHVLLALLLLIYCGEPMGTRRLAILAFLGSLCLLSRLDLALLLLPPLAFATGIARRRLLAVLVGFTPLLAWEFFSLLYYGSFVPNTAYAKLNTGIGQGELALQGLAYLWNSLRWDPVTLVAIALGSMIPVIRANRRDAALSVGVVLYLLYIVRIGGDFMSGRFLTAPLLVSVILLSRLQWRAGFAWPTGVIAVLLVTASSCWTLIQDRRAGEWPAMVDKSGIADERLAHRDTTVRGAFRHSGWPPPARVERAKTIRAALPLDPGVAVLKELGIMSPGDSWPPPSPEQDNGVPYRKVAAKGSIGFLGFYLGPEVHVVDLYALADPLLARLPAMRPDPTLARTLPQLAEKGWRVGHYLRQLPDGYLESLATGRQCIRDPDLARYYEELRLIVSGPLLDPGRLRAIWRLNNGAYDPVLRQYRVRALPMALATWSGRQTRRPSAPLRASATVLPIG
jgi:arabinofuranosyltransferase